MTLLLSVLLALFSTVSALAECFDWLWLIVGMTLLTIDDVAERLKCSDDQVRVLIRTNQLPHINIGAGKQRKCVRVTEDALADFLTMRLSEKPQPQPRRKAAPKPQREWV